MCMDEMLGNCSRTFPSNYFYINNFREIHAQSEEII